MKYIQMFLFGVIGLLPVLSLARHGANTIELLCFAVSQSFLAGSGMAYLYILNVRRRKD